MTIPDTNNRVTNVGITTPSTFGSSPPSIASLMDSVDSLSAADLIHGAWCVPLRKAVHSLAIADDVYNMLESCPPDDAPSEWWLDRLAGQDMPTLTGLMADVLTDEGKTIIHQDYNAGIVYYIG